MEDAPRRIAAQLISERGPDGALAIVRAAVEEAHARGDNYRLSVWREVRLAIRNLAQADQG